MAVNRFYLGRANECDNQAYGTTRSPYFHVCLPINQLAADQSSDTNNAVLWQSIVYTRCSFEYGSMQACVSKTVQAERLLDWRGWARQTGSGAAQSLSAKAESRAEPAMPR
jgi:hypothetical protein